jgi:hypothetical protein
MKRFAALCLSALFAAPFAAAHPGHDHADDETHHDTHSVRIRVAQNTGGVTGQGDLKFRLLYGGDHLPAEAIEVLTAAHGGFAVDRRDGKGEVYFALPGAGIIQISRDLQSTRMLPTDPEMAATNMHNASIWTESGKPYLVFPGNQIGKVYTTALDGSLLHTLNPPGTETTFGPAVVNDYFAAGEKFVPTDVDYLGGRYYIATGYSSLDYVLTANVTAGDAVAAEWNGLAFGGKGTEPGQFQTGHGITIAPDGKTIAVADRPLAEIDHFTADGEYLNTIKIPEGAFACDIDYEAGYAVVGCLHGPDRDKGAPIYILKGDKVVSTLMPKEDLGLENFVHIHNAVITERDGKLYVIAQAWNPGDFAILEQVD